MPAKTNPRGRPKGSGLDDRGHLEAIEKLISVDPELKPTTAIRALGISDPSTIRRLRDKYKKFQVSAAAALKSVEKEPKVASEADLKTVVHGKRQSSPSAAKRSLQNNSSNSAPNTIRATKEPRIDPLGLFAALFGIGIQVAAVSAQTNAAAVQHVMNLPPVAYMWCQQIAFNEAALHLYKNQMPYKVRA